MNKFNYQHLYYFYRIAQKNSFSEAAKRLHISQPALSMQMKQFETQWGFSLFNRKKRQIALTERGHTLYEYAKAIFDLGEEAEEVLLNASDRALPLSIRMGVVVAVPKPIVHAILEYLYQKYPDIQLTLKQDRLENMMDSLSTHKLDFIVNDEAYPSETQDGFQNHLMATIPMVFCASKTMARKYANLPEDLNHAPLILPTSPDRTYHAMQNYIHINKIKPNVIAEVENLELVRHLVAQGKGIGLLNQYAVMHSPEVKKLVIFKDRSKFQIQDTIYLIKRERKIPHLVVEDFIENFKL